MTRDGNCTAIFKEYGWSGISRECIGNVLALTNIKRLQGEIAVDLKLAYKIGFRSAGKWDTIAVAQNH